MNPHECEICNSPLSVRWTDHHGVGDCVTCGAPYRVLHYEDGKRVEKAPQIQFQPWYIPFARQYWQEVGRDVDPGGFMMPGSDYETATREDFKALHEWTTAHASDLRAAGAEGL